MRVLVIEDESVAASFLRKGLRSFGHAVDIAATAEEALYMAAISDYDILLLDVVLGEKSGLQVCREVRAAKIEVNILMLTARDGVEERVSGLDAGADDYLTKPYQFQELLARMRALERRSPIRHLGVITVADLTLDMPTRCAARAGRVLDLTSKEYSLLEYLARRSGHVVSHCEISEHVWDERYDPFSNLIEVYIHRLRRKIDCPRQVRLIHTRRGQGYMLCEETGLPNV